jgi:hypothetical protein
VGFPQGWDFKGGASGGSGNEETTKRKSWKILGLYTLKAFQEKIMFQFLSFITLSILPVVKEYDFGSQIFKKGGIFLRTYSFFLFRLPGFLVPIVQSQETVCGDQVLHKKI